MMLKVSKTSISDVILIEPKVYKDDRGFFFESFNQQAFHTEKDLNKFQLMQVS